MHKLRAAMVRTNRDQIGAQSPLEMDIAFVGGKRKGGVQRKTDKAPMIIAVEIRVKEVRDPGTNKIVQRALAGRMRLRTRPWSTSSPKTVSPPGAVIRDVEKLNLRWPTQNC